MPAHPSVGWLLQQLRPWPPTFLQPRQEGAHPAARRPKTRHLHVGSPRNQAGRLDACRRCLVTPNGPIEDAIVRQRPAGGGAGVW